MGRCRAVALALSALLVAFAARPAGAQQQYESRNVPVDSVPPAPAAAPVAPAGAAGENGLGRGPLRAGRRVSWRGGGRLGGRDGLGGLSPPGGFAPPPTDEHIVFASTL